MGAHRALLVLGTAAVGCALLTTPTDRRTLLHGLTAASTVSILGGNVALPPPAALAAEQYAIDKAVAEGVMRASLAAAPTRDVIITGASSGVGINGAKLLAAAGHRVVCACRNQAKAEFAATTANEFAAATGNDRRAPGSAVGAVCDLADLGSVWEFAEQRKGQPCSSLCLNAGVAFNTKDAEAQRTKDGFELTIGTNHLGHFLLANLMVDQLTPGSEAGAPRPRVVATASPVHDPLSGGGNVGSKATLGDLAGLAAGPRFDMVDGGPYDADKAYKDSKLCNMLFTAEAARRWQTKGVDVNAFSPGLIPDPNGFFRYQNQLFAKIFDFIANNVARVAETPEFGGLCLAYMAVDPGLSGETNQWYDTYPPGAHQLASHLASAEARNVAEQTRLWELSEKLVGLS